MAISQDIYDDRIFKEYADQGASLVFESAAPGLSGGQVVRDWEPGFSCWKDECKSKLGKYAAEDGICLLYTSDAADDRPCVDLGGRRNIQKKQNICFKGI